MAARIVDQKRLKSILRNGKFEMLTPEDWQLFFKTWAREQEFTPVSYETELLNVSVEWVFNRLIGPRSAQENVDPYISGAVFLTTSLSTSARVKLSEGLNLWARECLDLLASGHPDAQGILQGPLWFEALFEGVLSGEIAEKIVLNRQINTASRLLVAVHLNLRSFPLSVPKLCWKKLQAEIPQTPEFAGPVMEWLVTERRELEALEIPILLMPVEDNPIHLWRIAREMGNALETVPSYANWQVKLKDLFVRYPPWVIQVLKENIAPNLVHESLKDIRTLIP